MHVTIKEDEHKFENEKINNRDVNGEANQLLQEIAR